MTERKNKPDFRKAKINGSGLHKNPQSAADGLPDAGKSSPARTGIYEKWTALDLYNEIKKRNSGKPAFVLHDGPPFSNGNIHMGTAMNKILKDIINKHMSMTGHYVPYVPGWDNHGMPIESAIIKRTSSTARR